jgi:hypothetical protein
VESGNELQIVLDGSGAFSSVAALADIWLAKQKSKRTRRASDWT